MKVLIINGSPRKNGNTSMAIDEMVKVFDKNGIETEIVRIGNLDICGCRACEGCHKTGRCVIDDIVNETAPKFEEADGMIVASPVYYASPNGNIISFLDRLFFSTTFDKRMKVGAAACIARRAGTTASCDVLNKYFLISGMPVAASRYWNVAFGAKQGEFSQDTEGLQIMRTLAENMTFLMKSIALGKEQFGLPEQDSNKIFTNFVR
ncbi:MAG: flavodoxin family protein [Lachnospiraceae bacterium]|nr:flavodoxin family protein [Lachnospiraceae bacterium]